MRFFPTARAVRRLAISAALLATACVGGNKQPVLVHLQLQDLVIDSGAGQTGVEGQALPIPIVVHGLLSDGTQDKTHVIYCQIVSGGGTVQVSGSPAVSGDGAEVLGPGDGTISVTWTLGAAGQPQQLHFYIPSSQTISTEVTATSTPAGG